MGNANRHISANGHGFVTGDPSTLSLLRMSDKVALTDVPIVIQGESGTGKEVLARRIHQNSKRASRALVNVSCRALHDNLLISELFGHEKGSTTGAHSQKVGLIELANGGTLLLDDVGEMSLEVQAKLSRVLQDGESYRAGGTTPIKVQVRLLCTTNLDLAAHVKSGKFREDLFYRLNTVVLRIPPLRQRPSDIGILVDHFLKLGASTQVKGFAPPALESLKRHHWPGNVRELQNTVERLKIFSESSIVSAEELNQYLLLGPSEGLGKENVETFDLSIIEKKHILKVLAHFEGNKTRAAGAMGITVKTLYNKLARYMHEQN